MRKTAHWLHRQWLWPARFCRCPEGRPAMPLSEYDRRGLRLSALALHKPHRRALRRFTDRLRVSHVVLLSLHERLHVCRRDQLRVVPNCGELARPIMSAGTRLHRHNAPRQGREERQHLVPPELLAEHDPAARIRTVNLKNRLGQIDADCANLAHGRLLQWCFNTSTLAHRCRQGASTPTLLIAMCSVPFPSLCGLHPHNVSAP